MQHKSWYDRHVLPYLIDVACGFSTITKQRQRVVPRAAGRVLEDVSIVYPCDALALQAGHSIDFFRGDSRMLRDRIARALPAWSKSIPGFHALLGMHAFGLEETGDYAQAEKQGRRAVELQRRDTWAWHAVAHTYEMRNQPKEGLAWMSHDADAWGADAQAAVATNLCGSRLMGTVGLQSSQPRSPSSTGAGTGTSTLITARSYTPSEPTTVALALLPSEKVTRNLSARATTC